MAVKWKYNQSLDPTWNWLMYNASQAPYFTPQAAYQKPSYSNWATSQAFINPRTLTGGQYAWLKERGAKMVNGLLTTPRRKVRYGIGAYNIGRGRKQSEETPPMRPGG